MKQGIELSGLLVNVAEDVPRQLEVFALLGLGMVESLSSGALSSDEAVTAFFNAQNCLFVRKQLRDKVADEVMSHGVQLRDLFEALTEKEAQQEFQRELGTIRSLCLQLLDRYRAAA